MRQPSRSPPRPGSPPHTHTHQVAHARADRRAARLVRLEQRERARRLPAGSERLHDRLGGALAGITAAAGAAAAGVERLEHVGGALPLAAGRKRADARLERGARQLELEHTRLGHELHRAHHVGVALGREQRVRVGLCQVVEEEGGLG